MANIFELVSQSCARESERTRLTFLHADDNRESLTGVQLIDRCNRAAATLRTLADQGDRVLLVFPPGLDFVVGFLSAIRAGLVPVPVSYPKPNRPLSRYARIVSDSQATLALTNENTLGLVDTSTIAKVNWRSIEQLERSNAEPSSASAIASTNGKSQSLALLQYTSGSTGDPKGVMVTHENLLANLQAINRGFQIDQLPPEYRIVCSWLPAYHDMGLIGGILSALCCDGHAVLMAPGAFLKNPFRWLQAISQFQARVTVAPSFGYQWATQRITDDQCRQLDLSKLQLAACGAEPIFPTVLSEFADRFASCGFQYNCLYPCYGLAESTLMVTGTDRGDSTNSLPGPIQIHVRRDSLRDGKAILHPRDDDTMALMSSGVVADQTIVRTVDPATKAPLDEGGIGEIWVHSPSVAAGYWQDSEKTQEVFHAEISSDSTRYMRTGDLGFFHQGQLFVTGRLKDLIIVGGQNHYPQDIERTIQQANPAFSELASAAFSTTGESTEELVVVVEVPRHTEASDCQELIRAIRVGIAREHELSVQEIVLVRLASIPRTSSGKVRRSECRQLLDQQQLKVLAKWSHDDRPDPSLFPDVRQITRRREDREWVHGTIRGVVFAWLKRHADTNVTSDCTFADCGVDSLAAVELSQQFGSWLDINLSPVAAWSYPNPDQFASHLVNLLLGPEETDQDEEASFSVDDFLDQLHEMDEETAITLLEEIEDAQ